MTHRAATWRSLVDGVRRTRPVDRRALLAAIAAAATAGTALAVLLAAIARHLP